MAPADGDGGDVRGYCAAGADPDRGTVTRMRPASRLLVAAALLAAACGTGEAAPVPSTGSTEAAPSTTAVVEVFEEVPPLHPSVDGWSAGTVEVVMDDGVVHRVAVRLARTPDQRSHGLMEVPDLPDGAGMWFVYDEDRTGGFWMKHTLAPLDITYVGADDRIVSVADAVPCEADPCPTYPPSGPYRNVLEVPAGYLDRIGAAAGDVVRLVAP